MQTNPALNSILFGIVSSLYLFGCNTGSTTDTPPTLSQPSDTEYTGHLLDSAVEGVTYTRSDGSAGMTDASGAFNYYDGETIDFSIGNIKLGTVQAPNHTLTITPAAPTSYTLSNGSSFLNYNFNVTPLTLTPDALNRDDPRVINKLIFLQTMDDDGDQSNGIRINDAVRQAAQNTTLDFSLSTNDFIAGPFATFVANLNNKQAFTANTPRTIVSEIDALRYFGGLLGNLFTNIGPIATPSNDYAWWLETGSCSGIGTSYITVHDLGVTFCPNVTGHDGCYNGVIRANGDITMPPITSNKDCAALEPGSASYTAAQCDGAEYYDLLANLKYNYTTGEISGQYEASCNESSINTKQTLTADFLDTSYVSLDLIRTDIDTIIAQGSCNVDSDCEVKAISSSVNCNIPDYVAYSPSTIDSAQFDLNTYSYSQLKDALDAAASSGSGVSICIILPAPTANCVNNQCQLQ